MIHFRNFQINTQALFKGCTTPKREPDYVSYSGSRYWYGTDKKGSFIIREADHWVNIYNHKMKKIAKEARNIASCEWSIKTNSNENSKTGKCYLEDFKKIPNSFNKDEWVKEYLEKSRRHDQSKKDKRKNARLATA